MAFPLTQEQRAIVNDRGGELLVSAAAGSGKTRVLVERLLDRVEADGLDIDRFLVITYTKAAAAELRARVAQELAERLARQPNSRHLRRQTVLVYRAQISTIHAFCGMLLRESGHLLELDPDFRLCDEAEARVLMAQTLDEVLERQYENLDPDGPFAQLVDTLSAGRDDSRLAQIVQDIFNRVQSHPDPEQWLSEQKRVWALEGVCDIAQTPWGALLLEQARRQARWCKERLTLALDLAGQDELLQTNYLPGLSACIERIDAFLSARTWDGAAARLPVALPPAGRKKKRAAPISPMQEALAERTGARMKAIRTRCKKQLEKTALLVQGDSATLAQELELSRAPVQALMELVIEFQHTYAQKKRRKNLLDFSDLEHFTVKLLLDKQGEPTALAQEWAARYAEVQVDEYQDTNQVQNAIFYAISDKGRKAFEVGDVKQSIYRFRLADPAIFLEKYRRFPYGASEGQQGPRKRILSCNFRSRIQVLEGCNDLFRNIMSAEMGELDYTDDQALAPGAEFPPGDEYALELNALDLSFLGEQEGEKQSKDLLEARFAAQRIRQMLSAGLMVTEGKGQRPLRPSDIMILLRSPGAVLHHYLRALAEERIDFQADAGEDFFATTEVNVALSILQIVDNPRQDVPLIAALRSPVYGFSGDQLALLRAGTQGDFYDALVSAGEQGDRASLEFLSQLARLRFGAGDKTCRQLIWHVYEATNILGIFGAMDRGRERQDNLLSLYALAGQFEQTGCRSLFQFLRRLDRLMQTGAKLTSAPSGREGDGVSILSIHRSKGLEKPVVLVCGLTRRFNRDDLMRPVLFHPELGIGPKGLDRDRMVEYPTLARQAVALRLERERLSEEMRLLYVAMTRAKEKLILNLALTDGLRTLERLGDDLSVPVSPMTLESQQNAGQWILLHALTRPEGAALRALAELPEIVGDGLGCAWDIRWIDGQTIGQPLQTPQGSFADLNTALEQKCGELKRALTWRYPHMAETDIPSKLTATQIKGRLLDREAAEKGAPFIHAPSGESIVYRPDFAAGEKGLTPAQQGSVMHQAMQYVPLTGDHSPEGIRALVKELVNGGFLTALEAGAVSPERLSAFFQSALGQEMARAEQCRREFKFSILVPAADYYPDAGPAEEVLLQGVVDAWFDDGDGITVLDFKSDRILPGGEGARAEEYRPQLEAYSRALSVMLNRPVKRKVLWFFATDTAFAL